MSFLQVLTLNNINDTIPLIENISPNNLSRKDFFSTDPKTPTSKQLSQPIQKAIKLRHKGTQIAARNKFSYTSFNPFLPRVNSDTDCTLSNLIKEEFLELYNEMSLGEFQPNVFGSSEVYFTTKEKKKKSSKDFEEYPSSQIMFSNLIEKEKKNKTKDVGANESPLIMSIKPKREYELKFIDSGENIRKSYMDKLKHTNIWTSEKPKSHNSLIIFDWDDTLLCSSYLTPQGIFKEDTKLSKKDLNKLELLDNTVFKILSFAIENSSTFIITNAAPGWVEYSSERFYPKTKEILKTVTIVSARGEYEKKFPGDSKQWKVQAFLETTRNLNLNLVTNLICLGDSVIEMEAAHILASKFSKAYIKTVKFKEAPKPEELIKQLGTVHDQLNTIFSTVKNLTIRVEKKKKSK